MIGKKRWLKEELYILQKEYEKGTPVKDIAKKLNRTYHSVSHKAIRLGFKHLYYLSTFQPIPTPEFAYCLGAWFDDRRSKYHLSIGVKDYDFVTSFATSLSKFLRVNLKIRKDDHLFWVQRRDKKFTEWIKQNSLEDITNFIISGGEKAISDFVKGFFDAEGSITERRGYISVPQRTRGILECCKVFLAKLDVKSSISKIKCKGRDFYVLRISNIPSLIRFHNKIGFNIKRKNAKLKEVITKIISSPSFTPVFDYFKFRKLVETGMKGYSIAKKLSVCTATIYLWLNGTSPVVIKNGLTEEDLKNFNNKL